MHSGLHSVPKKRFPHRIGFLWRGVENRNSRSRLYFNRGLSLIATRLLVRKVSHAPTEKGLAVVYSHTASPTNTAMAHHMAAGTLLVKGCPDTVLDVVVSAIEEFGFSRSILAVQPNVTLDQAPPQPSMAHSKHVIYMKAAPDGGAEAQLRSFVESELNLKHNCAMYCIAVKPRNYPVHFALLLSHVKGPPTRTSIQEIFEPFGKCNVRTKDHTMTYINFPRYAQVVQVLEARNQAKLVLNDMVVLVDQLVPVQNAKLMISFEMLLKERRAVILQSKCITKQNLCTWFNAARKNESCDKTWDQLVDFVANCIHVTFGWTYNSKEEIFHLSPQICMKSSAQAEDTVVVQTLPCKAAVAGGTGVLVHQNVSATQQTPLVQCVGSTSEVPCGSDGSSHTIFHQATEWKDENSFCPDTQSQKGYDDAGIVHEVGSTELGRGADDLAFDDGVVHPVGHAFVDKTNYIPLYGDESHPLHHRLCFFESHLFGRMEQSNACIQYRLNNMETMLNIQNDMQPLSVRLTLIEYWTKQYMDVMRTLPTVQLDVE